MKKRIVSLILALTLILGASSALSFSSGAAATSFTKVNYLQSDSRWGLLSYNNSYLRASGCGILSIVNAVYNSTGNFIEPKAVADWAYAAKYFNQSSSGGGGICNNAVFFQSAVVFGAQYGFTVLKGGSGNSSSAELREHVKNVGTAVVLVPGHYMCLVDYSDATGKFLVFDCAPGSGSTYNSINRRNLTTAGGDWKTPAELNTGYLKISAYWLFAATGGATYTPNPNDYTFPTRDLYYNSSSVMTGDDVRWVQAVLYRLGFAVTIDGSFGPGTKTAIQQFQSAYGLTVDGSCGPTTRSKLRTEWNKIDPSAPSYSFNYDANGGTLGELNCAFVLTYGEYFCVDYTDVSRDGYTFAGWNVRRNNDNTWYVTGKGWCTESTITSNGYTKRVYNNAATLLLDTSWTNGITGDGSYTFFAIWTASHTTHTYAVSSTVAATCTSAGSRTYTCSVCGNSYIETIPAKGHAYGAWTVQTAATCTANGTEKRVCANDSSHVETRTITATGHAYGSWTVQTAATCTTNGTEKRVCANNSSHVETRTITATGHAYGAWTVKTVPTCTKNGTEKRVCANDPSHVETRSIAATGHSFGSWTVQTSPTCTTDGVQKRVCVNDPSHVETRAIPAIGHSFVNGVCAVCGAAETSAESRIAAADVISQAGRQIAVPVTITNNPGISALILKFSYDDSVLTLDRVENGGMFSGFTKGLRYVFDECFDVTDDGVLMTFVFTVSAGASAGDYPIGVTIVEASNYDLEDVMVSGASGKVTVSGGILYGDANGDGEVTMKDIVLLRKYVANLDDVTGTSNVDVMAGADANGDGVVTMKDIVLLRKYVANYDDASATSTVVLGPQ